MTENESLECRFRSEVGGDGSVEAEATADPVSDALDRGICEFESLEFDRHTDECQFSFDPEAWSASVAVVSALAVLTDTDPLDLPPLDRSVDSHALDRLVDPNSERTADATVRFSTDGYDVAVDSDGHVTLRRREENDGAVC